MLRPSGQKWLNKDSFEMFEHFSIKQALNGGAS